MCLVPRYWFLVPRYWFLVIGSWFLVLGSWFLVLGWRDLTGIGGGEEIADKTANFGMGERSLVVDAIKLLLGNVGLIQSYVELTLNLRTRTLGIAQELDELGIAPSVEAFGYVVHR